jgi:small GTP-binding protein
MKFLVTGAFQCGKSQYIQALDKNALNIASYDKNGWKCTVGMDVGNTKSNGFDISLFGTPGLLRFSAMRAIVARGSDGVIFLFDGPSPEKDDASIQILNEIRHLLGRNIPIVYAVNKSDIPECRPVEVVRAQNYLGDHSILFKISAKTGENINVPIDELAHLVKQSLSPMVRIICEYEGDILGLQKELGKDSNEIMDVLNGMELRGIVAVDRAHKSFKIQETAKFFTE